MSSGQIIALGALAGSTIFLGLPAGRIQRITPRVKGFLAATATGILLFLLWDVLSAAIDPVESAVTSATDESGSWLRLAGLGALFVAGISLGLLGLVAYDRWFSRRRARAMLGPGSASAAEFETSTTLSTARQLSLFIATGIGAHNFAEGLAIGQAATANDISLALLLVIGFGLHNATEGFGIVAPLSGEAERPSWSFLALLGVVGGGPTFVGTVVGQAWTSDAISVVFLAVAAGSILYVVLELVGVVRALCGKQALATGILLGLLLGIATDLVLVAAGA